MPHITYAEPVRWYHHVFFWTKPLPRAVPVRFVRREPLETGVLLIVVEMRNNTSEELQVEYQARFLDTSGVELEQGPWIRKTLPARIEEQVVFNSIGTAATDWRLHIRWAE